MCAAPEEQSPARALHSRRGPRIPAPPVIAASKGRCRAPRPGGCFLPPNALSSHGLSSPRAYAVFFQTPGYTGIPKSLLSGRGRSCELQPPAHLLPRSGTGAPKRQLSFPKNQKIRNRLYTEPSRELWVGLDIHLEHQRLPCHFPCELPDLRSGHPARSAPFCPKVHQHWNRGLVGDGVKQSLVADSNWLVGGPEGSFADATAPGVGQPAGGNAILGSTGRAGADDRVGHWTPQLSGYQCARQRLSDRATGFPVSFSEIVRFH